MGMSREPEGGEQSQVSGVITLSEALFCLFSCLYNFLSPSAGPLADKKQVPTPLLRLQAGSVMPCWREDWAPFVLPSPQGRGGQDLPRLCPLPTQHTWWASADELLGYEAGFSRTYK